MELWQRCLGQLSPPHLLVYSTGTDVALAQVLNSFWVFPKFRREFHRRCLPVFPGGKREACAALSNFVPGFSELVAGTSQNCLLKPVELPVHMPDVLIWKVVVLRSVNMRLANNQIDDGLLPSLRKLRKSRVKTRELQPTPLKSLSPIT